MRILWLKPKQLFTLELPQIASGSYFFSDVTKQEESAIFIEEYQKRWLLKSGEDYQILWNGKEVDSIFLEEGMFYTIRSNQTEIVETLYVDASYQAFDGIYEIPSSFRVGKSSENQISLNSPYLSDACFEIKKVGDKGKAELAVLDTKLGVYVNGIRIAQTVLEPGDIIFLMGFSFLYMDGKILFPKKGTTVRGLKEVSLPKEDNTFLEKNDHQQLQPFLPAPRFLTKIEKEKVTIDPPPAKSEQENMPLIYTMGPMLTMGMASVVMGFVAMNAVFSKQQTWSSAMPSVIIAVSMLLSMLLWPLLTRKYQERQTVKKEALREEKYLAYLEEKKHALFLINTKQKQILLENNFSLMDCSNIILQKERNLWVRSLLEEDFLTVRLGIGDVPLEVDITYPEDHFYLSEDHLKTKLNEVVESTKTIYQVPITTSFLEKPISAVVGKDALIHPFTNGLLLQLMALHSYEELKIVILTDEVHENNWRYMKSAPHCFNRDRTFRYFASTLDSTMEMTRSLEQVLYHRTFEEANEGTEKREDYKSFRPYYLIVTDNYASLATNSFLMKLLEQDINRGFSLVILNERLRSLPSKCQNFINIGEQSSGVFENELVADKQKTFKAEYPNQLPLAMLTRMLLNLPVESMDKEKSLPTVLGFLEMYQVDSLKELNVLTRWKKNDPTVSLRAPLGVDEHGALFALDLHEKNHGPHGLVAGMTGSGKSELLITYILSLAINYHPNEVSFVLIDYKGGGLAGAFYNKEKKVRLPHLVGTITNLDTAEMNRALASIESELRRRQKLFNQARDLLSEGTIDIYKYQRLYRDGMVKEPVPHLFIISDEFAELKAQRPEFMEQLISTARIGRSLGVHLILATQKPSGIVDDQIWSNSRFRICLKVQEKTDSQDVIKCPNAAYLKETGRFYLQVGYNELFLLGQSAWSGIPYQENVKKVKKEEGIYFVDETASIYKRVEEEKLTPAKDLGEELVQIVNHLDTLAKQQALASRNLWLERIPGDIYLADLEKKYPQENKPYLLNPIIGEYDDPSNQRQDVLTLPLSQKGNTIIYGSPNSGKELLLNAILYSTMKHHSSLEVEFYILDFGAEMLKVYKDAPQVGDILTIGDVEKTRNLMKMLQEEIDTRKQILLDYNGDFSFYVKQVSNPLPYKIVMLNNYDAFKESYESLEDVFLQLTRDGFKYGIIFVLTTNNANTIRYRLRQNFKQELVLQFNDETDYAMILGRIHGMAPSNEFGRGLVRVDEVYEFQTARICPLEKQSAYLKAFSKQLKEMYPNTKAAKVPVLPEIVTKEEVIEELTSYKSVPLGVYKEDLHLAKWNFDSAMTTLITGYDASLFLPFLESLIEECILLKEREVEVFDFALWLPKQNDITYIGENFQEAVDQFEKEIMDLYQIYQKNGFQKSALSNAPNKIVFLLGFERVKNILTKKDQLFQLLQKAKELGIYHFILVDTIDALSKMEYESWYKDVVSSNTGLWFGNGITEQYTLKLSKTPRSLYDELATDFGYVIERGVPHLVKWIHFKEEEDE